MRKRSRLFDSSWLCAREQWAPDWAFRMTWQAEYCRGGSYVEEEPIGREIVEVGREIGRF